MQWGEKPRVPHSTDQKRTCVLLAQPLLQRFHWQPVACCSLVPLFAERARHNTRPGAVRLPQIEVHGRRALRQRAGLKEEEVAVCNGLLVQLPALAPHQGRSLPILSHREAGKRV